MLQRRCRDVVLVCHTCNSMFALRDYRDAMDERVEEFLANTYADRI